MEVEGMTFLKLRSFSIHSKHLKMEHQIYTLVGIG